MITSTRRFFWRPKPEVDNRFDAIPFWVK